MISVTQEPDTTGPSDAQAPPSSTLGRAKSETEAAPLPHPADDFASGQITGSRAQESSGLKGLSPFTVEDGTDGEEVG